MAGVVSDESGAGRSVEGIANGQHCQSGEALAEWRSSEQLENGTPSTSPPFWDTDDEDDDDAGPRPSELYGKHTWKIEKFSQINKRELRSNAFEVGGYKWYILIYPQGCDVCNHLSLFLCVANHEKLLPGWSHFAQFTIAVVNKDLKKSKYSDTLHRFWKKEHDWGWKKFMELSKVFDGFIDADTLIIKAQVQVIRERADRPFRCLDCQYRRELVRVYLTNVEQICRRFVEDSRGKLEALIEDKAKWSSFCAFWLGIDQNLRRRMSREKTDVILKVVVKHFFIEKEVTSTLVMDSLYSGLKALEGHVKCGKGKLKFLDTDEMPAPIIHVENDTFVLVDDVLLLLERIALEPLPPKDEKAPQNRTKDGNFGEDFSKDSIERDERRLTVLGRRTVEIFVLAHIFSNKIEVAYQEAVALKRQEELIREEEAAWLAESEQKAKRASEKEKKSKKKQGKQKRNSRKSKDKAREEKSSIAELLKPQEEDHGYVKEAITLEEIHTVAEKSDPPEDASDVSDSMEGVNEELLPDSEDQDASPVNWDTDTSEIRMPTEASSSELNGLSCVGSANTDKKNSSTVDDSSSTCSTDSVPSVVGGPYRGGNSSEHQNKNLPSRGRSQRSKATSDGSDWALETDGQLSQAVPDRGDHDDASVSSKVCESESDAVVSSSSTDQIKWPVQQTSFEEEAVQKNIGNKEPLDSEKAKERLSVVVSSSPGIPKNPVPPIQFRSEYRCGVLTNLVPIKKVSLNSSQTDLVASSSISSQSAGLRKSESQKAVTSKPAEKSITPQVMSRPSSAPLIPASRPTPPVVPLIHTAPSISRSVSAVGRLGPDTLPAIHSHVPLSYRNAIMGNHVGPSSGLTHSSSSSSGVSSLPAYSQPSSLASGRDTDSVQSSFPFGVVARDSSSNGSQWIDNSQRDATSRLIHRDSPSLVNSIQDFDLRRAVYSGSREQLSNDFLACTSGRHTQGAMADEFPHLDIINDLLNEENGIGKASRVGTSLHSISSGSPLLNRQFSFPPDTSMSGELGSPSSSSCRFERTQSYHEDEFQHGYRSLSGQFNGFAEYIPQVAGLHYANGQMEGLVPAQWRMTSSDLSLLTMRHAEGDSYHYFGPEYSNLACGVNGYSVFRPSK